MPGATAGAVALIQSTCSSLPFNTCTLEKLMPKVSDMIISKFLRKEDIDVGDEADLTIRGVSLETLEGSGTGEQRWAIHFAETTKMLVANVTTIRVLEAAFGGDTDQWIGKRVILYIDPNVSFGGKVVGGLRLRPVVPKKPGALVGKGKLGNPPAAAEFDDEIP
jgi:hypothetical protein